MNARSYLTNTQSRSCWLKIIIFQLSCFS